MSEFEFVLVVISIILGLGMTELLALLARILRGELRPGWLHLGWMAHVGVSLVQQFWSRWVHADRPDWTLWEVTVLLIPAFLGFLAAALLAPRANAEVEGLDSYFLDRRAPFFVVMMLLMASYALEDLVLGTTTGQWVNAIRLFMILLFLWPMRVRGRGAQVAAWAIATTSLIVFAFGWTSSLSFLSTLAEN